MVTVFMKWLEKKPSDYDRGIDLLTLGKLEEIKSRITDQFIQPENRVLEIGCGTGKLALSMARKGAFVEAIDVSPAMLAETRARIEAHHVEKQVNLYLLDAMQIEERFLPGSFDVIVSTLVFSELSPESQHQILAACSHLLAPDGQLLIADEVIPPKRLARILYNLVHYPLALLIWLLTRTSTHALENFNDLMNLTGFDVRTISSYMNGSLVLYEAVKSQDTPEEPFQASPVIKGRLSARVTFKSILIDLWAIFLRIIPPYPKVNPGLYFIGSPTPHSPVLVTGNFALTVQRLVRAIDGCLDSWVLVVDSAGINNWCAAGGGFLTAGKIIRGLYTSQLDKVVSHHSLVLPQLCANGVDGWKIRNETGWGVHWGPVRAKDLPIYIKNKYQKTDQMRQVRFTLLDRIEMVCVTLGFYGLLVLLPVWIFGRHLFYPLGISLVSISIFYALAQPWLPGKDGLYKSIPLAIISLLGFYLFTWGFYPLNALHLFNWTLGLIGVSVFVAAEMQGMSPRMRGEQANWGLEILIAGILLLLYWIVPRIATWR